MTTFLIGDITIKMNPTDTMNHLKELIIKQMKLDTEYIDLKFNLDKPIRGFGKMNLESGILPRTMDHFPLNRYNLEGKEITCEFIPVDDYMPNVHRNNDVPDSVYKAPGMKNRKEISEKNPVKNEPTFNLNSETDFPSL